MLAALIATPAQAQTPQTSTINPIRSNNQGASINVNPTAKWNEAQGAWLVSFSVDVNLILARIIIQDGYSPDALAEYDANIKKYNGKPWYQMRYANTYKDRESECEKENPAA